MRGPNSGPGHNSLLVYVEGQIDYAVTGITTILNQNLRYLDVRADDALVLKNAGPTSASAMPEAGYLPIPKKLAAQGVKDMVRVSDARMSGTAFGAVVLHVAPDAASGGPLALVETGDRISLSVSKKSIELLVPDDELARRRERLPAAPAKAARGYAALYDDHITQAPAGCDFDILQHPNVR